MKRPSHVWWCRYSSMMETHPPELSELVRSQKECLYYFSGICKHSLNLKPDDRPCDAKCYNLVLDKERGL